MLPKQDMPISAERPPALGHHCFFFPFQTSANSCLKRMKNASNVTGFARFVHLPVFSCFFFFFLSPALQKQTQNCHELTAKPVFVQCLFKERYFLMWFRRDFLMGLKIKMHPASVENFIKKNGIFVIRSLYSKIF